MAEPMYPLPKSADDARLDGWYHTLELAPGIITRAVWDHRPTVDRVGLPPSLVGKTALDVGTADGFWAFEMERRGADRVVAIDVARAGDVDLLPRHRALCPDEELNSENWAMRFLTAQAMLGSRVDYRNCSVYDLSPERVGRFDVVYCGSLLIHLFNPLQALINIRNVTKEIAVIETTMFHPDPLQETFPDRPYLWFGKLDYEGDRPGFDVGYWSFTPRALCDMLIYAGFAWVEPLDPFPMQRAGLTATIPVTPIIAHVTPNPEIVGYRKTKPQRVDEPHPSPVRSPSRLRRILSSIKSSI
jgi:tRNA (mo5U34)-methyltransferase